MPEPAPRTDTATAARTEQRGDPRDPRTPREDKRSLLQRLIEFIRPGPDSREELTEALADAEDNDVINAETRGMLDGVIRLSDMTAGDVMVAAPRMDVIDIDAPFDAMLSQIITTAHSRFPVIQGERDNIIGILLAKDLLKLQRAPELNVRALLRPATFVPESKALDNLLREFRGNRNHLAIVVDEFGRVAGLITIEDVLEEIVGEIEDEFDIDEDAGDIFALADKSFRVSGDTPVEEVNEAFSVHLAPTDSEQDFETIGGLIAHEMGHVPRRGESHTMAGLRFAVLHTKGGAVRWFKVSPANLTPHGAAPRATPSADVSRGGALSTSTSSATPAAPASAAASTASPPSAESAPPHSAEMAPQPPLPTSVRGSAAATALPPAPGQPGQPDRSV